MRYRRLLIGVIAILLITGVYVYFTGRSRSVAYHLARFTALKTEAMKGNASGRGSPSALRGSLRFDTLRWYLKGRPSWTDEWLEEQQSLVNLGYFERRELVLTNRQAPMNPSDAALDPAVREAFFGGLNSSWFVHMDGKRPSWIRVTGTNLDVFEQIVRRWDAQGTP
jgi:hypothetical protein